MTNKNILKDIAKDIMAIRQKINTAYQDPLTKKEMDEAEEARHILWNLAFLLQQRIKK